MQCDNCIPHLAFLGTITRQIDCGLSVVCIGFLGQYAQLQQDLICSIRMMVCFTYRGLNAVRYGAKVQRMRKRGNYRGNSDVVET